MGISKQIGWGTESNILYEILKELKRLKSTIFGLKPKYKVYTALLSQSGTNNPTVDILENTLGFDLNWVRANTGFYNAVHLQNLPRNKTFWFNGNFYDQDAIEDMIIFTTSEDGDVTNSFIVYYVNSGNFSDNFEYLPIEIRIYN
jgi:hypothetical protein